MIRGFVVVSGVVLALSASCGKTKEGGSGSKEAPDAGETGAGGASTGGSSTQGGTTGAGMAGSDDGGEPSEGGAPTGGSSGASTGGAGMAGSSTAGASMAGAAGASSIRLPDDCDSGSQQIGGTYCSVEMTCDSRRLNVSCTFAAGLWSCSCSDAVSRVDYEFPDASSITTCEAAAKACADPSILTGDETCTRTRTMGASACAIHDSCERQHDLDGVTLITRTARDRSCSFCSNPTGSCCYCRDGNAVDYRIREIALDRGCDFLDELCKPDNVDPVGAKTCDVLSEYEYPDQSCELEVQCDLPVQLGDGTRLNLVEQLNTWCYARDEGLRCTCTNEDRENVGAIDFGMSSANIATCTATTAVCAGTEAIVPTAPLDCTATSDIVLSDGCTLYLECSQPATVAGTPVTVYSNVGAQCGIQPDGSYSCYCNHRTSGPHEIEAADVRSACEEAVEVCPKLSPAI